MKLIRATGATSQILQVFIADSSSTTGAGLTGLVFNSGGLTAYYHRDNDTTATAISLVTMTVGTFTSSGFKEIDSTNMPGWYQFCPPNAALAGGAKSVGFMLKGATDMAPLPIEIDLATSVDVASINNQTTVAVTTILPVLGTPIAPQYYDIAVLSATPTTIALATTDAFGNAVPDVDQYTFTSFQVVGGTGIGQIIQTTTAAAGSRNYNVLDGTMPTQVDNTSQLLNLGSYAANANVTQIMGEDEPASGLKDAGQDYFDKASFNADLFRVFDTALTESVSGRLAASMSSLFGNLPGAANGPLIAGSNAATTFAALNVTGNLTVGLSFNVTSGVSFGGGFTISTNLIVGGTTTLTGAVTASNASNNITGIVLRSNGLDSISTTAPTGVAANFREMMVQLWRRFFTKARKDDNTGTIVTYADNGTTPLTTQSFTNAGGVETVNTAT